MEIIDSHTHLGCSFSAAYFTDHSYPAEELLEHMDRCGVSKAVVMAGGKPPQLSIRNEWVRKAVRMHPDRLIGLVRVNPLAAGELEMARDCIVTHGFKGIKLHPTQDGYPASDYCTNAILDLAEELRVPVLIHSGTIPYTMPGQIADLARQYPRVSVIMAHAGKLELKEHTVASAARSSNIYLEFSFSLPLYVRKAIDAVGPKRVLFGSNWPAASMKPWTVTVKQSPLFNEEEKRRFLGENARVLFNI